MPDLDALDLALLTALRENPRAGALALSRLTRVARATVESRLSRLERSGVITGYGPDIDVAAERHRAARIGEQRRDRDDRHHRLGADERHQHQRHQRAGAVAGNAADHGGDERHAGDEQELDDGNAGKA